MDLRTWTAGGTRTAVNGHRIWWRSDGDGPSLLFLHGFPSSSHDWAPAVQRLSSRFRCVTVDLLGFGQSDKPRLSYSYARQVAVVDAIAATSGAREWILVAHDYSTTIAQELLARGARVGGVPIRGAVLLNGGVEPSLHRSRMAQDLLDTRLGRILGPWLFPEWMFKKQMRQVLGRPSRVAMTAMWEALSANEGRSTLPLLLHYLDERRRSRQRLIKALVESPVPLGFIWGVEDPVSGAHILEWIRANVPRADVLALDGIGHYPQIEAAEPTAARIAALAGSWSRP